MAPETFTKGDIYFWSYSADASITHYPTYRNVSRYFIIEEREKNGVKGIVLRDLIGTSYSLDTLEVVPYLDDLSAYELQYVGNIEDCLPVSSEEVWMYHEDDIIVGLSANRDRSFISYIKTGATVDREIMTRHYDREIQNKRDFINNLESEITKIASLKQSL